MKYLQNLKALWTEHKNIYSLFLILVFLFYGNTLKNQYSLDDDYITATNFPIKGQPYVPNNKLIKDGFKSIPTIWVSRYAHDSESSFDYRPVVTTTFAIEYAIFGQNPFVSHLINVILYFFLICLIFKTLLQLFQNEPYGYNLAFISSLIFLIHPIHTEVVASLKCRDELLAMLFSIMGAKHFFYLLENFKVRHLILFLLYLFLGFFSKLSAVLIMTSIPLMILFYRKTNIKIMVLSIISLMVIYYSFQAFSSYMPTEEHQRSYYRFENPLYTDHFSFFGKIIIGIKTFGFYIQMLFFPFPLRYYYGSDTFDLSTSFNQYFAVTVIFTLLCIFYFYKTKNKNFLFAFLLTGLLMFPFLNIVETVAGIVADRLAFISSLGFCILVSVVILPFFKDFNYSKFKNLFDKPMLYLSVIICVCMIYTIKRNNNWYNKITLFEHDISYLSKSAKANSLISNEYFEMLQKPTAKYPPNVLIQKCLHHYSAAVSADSTIYTAYNNLGVVYYSYINDINMAKKLFKLGIKYKKDYAQAYENLGNCYKRENNVTEAFKNYKKAIMIKPNEYAIYYTTFNLFFEAKQYEKSINFLKIAQNIFPNNYELIASEGNSRLMMKDTSLAIINFEKAYKINPNSGLAEYLRNLATKTKDTTLFNKYKNL